MVNMALIKCPECGKEISSMEKSCPNCGYHIESIKKRKTFLCRIADLLDISVKELFGVIGGQAIIVATIMLFLGGCDSIFHSNTYNEYMSRIKAREAAINNASSLFDMAKLDERILPLGALDDLTDGDEKRAIRLAHDGVWESLERKCQQLSVGKYRLTSKKGNTYIIELTNEVQKDDGYRTHYIARIYKNNSLPNVGMWYVHEVSPHIVLERNTNTTMDRIDMWISPSEKSQVLTYGGWLDGEYYVSLSDEFTVKKIM